jgi:hypothetical protein
MTDPREDDYSREGIFRYHDCAYCKSGEKPEERLGAEGPGDVVVIND